MRAQARGKVSRGQWDEGLRLYIESVNGFRGAAQHNEVAFTLAEVAEGLATRGKAKHAAAFYEQALSAAAKMATPEFLAPILRDAGLFFAHQGDGHKAREMLKDGFELFEILKDEWSQAMIAHELGRIAAHTGASDDALDWYRKGLGLVPEERDADLRMRTFYDMGMSFRKKGLNDRAHSCFNNAALIAKKIFEADYLVSSLEQLGRLDLEKGDIGSAKRFLKEAFAMNEGLLTSKRPGAAHDEADDVYEKRKDELVDLLISTYLADPNVTVSEREIAEFLAHLHKRRDAKGLAAALAKIADYFRVRGEHARAARFFENASGIFERAGMGLVTAQIAEILGDLYRDRGLPRKAFNRYWKGASLLEDVTGPDGARMKKALNERMEALKPALSQAVREGDEAGVAAGTSRAEAR